jgi:hypothetical protein
MKGNEYANLFCVRWVRGKKSCEEGCDFEEGYEKEKKECVRECGRKWNGGMMECFNKWRDWRVGWNGFQPVGNDK